MAGFDAALYGRLLYALRHVRGYRTGAELANAVTAHGVETTERTIWAIERGEQEAKIGRHMIFVHLLKPRPGYFEEAYTPPVPDLESDSDE